MFRTLLFAALLTLATPLAAQVDPISDAATDPGWGKTSLAIEATVVSSTPAASLFGHRFTVLTVDAGSFGTFEVLCFNDLFWPCRRRAPGTEVTVGGPIFAAPGEPLLIVAHGIWDRK